MLIKESTKVLNKNIRIKETNSNAPSIRKMSLSKTKKKLQYRPNISYKQGVREIINFLKMINKVLENLIFVRFCQLLINDKIKNKEFKIPIHLAFGHEAIATSIAMNFAKNDNIILTHRNIHYNLAISNDFKSILNEFRLKNSGLAKGRLGSMNLCSPKDGIVYSSSILGNSLPVAAGVAHSTKLKNTTFVVTGDGAMEEGSFYETIVFGNSIDLSMIIIVENNNWSMYTPIKKRRKKIDLKKFSKSLGVNYFLLDTNNVFLITPKTSRK